MTENLTSDDRSDSVVLKKARMTRQSNGNTVAKLTWKGLRPNFKYPSHVHATRCTEVSNGGPHYVRDIECVGSEGNAGVGCQATAETEFWTGGTSNQQGQLKVKTKIPHLARSGALSLVLHECLDADGEPAYDGKWFFNQGNWAKIDPHVEMDLYMKMMRFILDKKGTLNEAGIETAQRFSWTNSASRILEHLNV